MRQINTICTNDTFNVTNNIFFLVLFSDFR